MSDLRNILTYKGYHTKIQFETESFTLRGKIEGIRDYVDFETNKVEDVEREFHAAVDDYLEFCAEVGKEPDKEYKGSFNVRIPSELHRELALTAFREDQSLNAIVEKALREYLNKQSITEIQVKHTITIKNGTFGSDADSYLKNVSVNAEGKVVPFPKNIKMSYATKQEG